ncbi:hypothetical protein GOP47_0015247 [Adiantum capillus-veneris]|uniref:Uncharacterized protein n=1 Tax=Adiantum capillus-veneris TaxID=13818 RepID=A0A9D4UJB7_ADICA|nr:hypothetical protein GOP47_0015247 [Adiantum capillus-veneris]
MIACKLQSHSHLAGPWKAWASQAPVALGRKRVRCAAQASSTTSSSSQRQEEENPLRGSSTSASSTSSSSSSSTSHDLKVALGIDPPQATGLGIPALERLLDWIEDLSESVAEATENERFQVGGGQFIVFLFPIWLLLCKSSVAYSLVALKSKQFSQHIDFNLHLKV